MRCLNFNVTHYLSSCSSMYDLKYIFWLNWHCGTTQFDMQNFLINIHKHFKWNP